MFANALKRRRPKPGDTWHMDEVFTRIRGNQLRLHRLNAADYRSARTAAFRTWREVAGVAAAA